MVIIQLAGGLGNQMFQYALYLQLKSLGREVKIDDVSGFAEDTQRTPALFPFGVSYERPSREELRRLLDDSPLPWDRVRRKLFGRKKKAYFEESKLFVPEVLTWDDIYLEGYWQSEKYFRAVKSLVQEAYSTDRLTDWLRREDFWEGGDAVESVKQYLAKIESTCSVSLHVRRGDYLTPENRALFGGICTDAYYIEGIRRMRERYPQCRFYLFCNDREWGKQEERQGQWEEYGITRIRLPEQTGFVEKADSVESTGAAGETESAGKYRAADYAEFLLMSRCKHHILANSSFSWWASYLNTDPKKTIFVPDRWINGTDCRDFYREDMQKIIL